MFENAIEYRYVARFGSGEVISTVSMRALYYSMRYFLRVCGKAEGVYYAAVEIDGILRFFVWFVDGKLEIVPCYAA